MKDLINEAIKIILYPFLFVVLFPEAITISSDDDITTVYDQYEEDRVAQNQEISYLKSLIDSLTQVLEQEREAHEQTQLRLQHLEAYTLQLEDSLKAAEKKVIFTLNELEHEQQITREQSIQITHLVPFKNEALRLRKAFKYASIGSFVIALKLCILCFWLKDKYNIKFEERVTNAKNIANSLV